MILFRLNDMTAVAVDREEHVCEETKDSTHGRAHGERESEGTQTQYIIYSMNSNYAFIRKFNLFSFQLIRPFIHDFN